MSTRSPRKRAGSSTSQQSIPSDAFYAPLFKDNPKKLAKFSKWINATSTEELTQILVAINEIILNAGGGVSDHGDSKEADKLSKRLEIIVLADIIQCGYRSYGLMSATDSDRKYEKALQALGVANADAIAMIIKLIKRIYKAHHVNADHLDECGVSYPHFEGLRWRLDVTISNSNLKRVLKPSLVLQFVRSDGTIKYMESSVENFHELRFNVSRVLREMQVLQKRFVDDDATHTLSAQQQQQNESAKTPQYIVKYKKLATIARVHNLSQLVRNGQHNSDDDGNTNDN